MLGIEGRGEWGPPRDDSCVRRGFRLPRSPRQRRVLALVCSVVTVYVVLNVAVLLITSDRVDVVDARSLEWNTRESDAEWIPALKYGKIVDCQVFKPGGSAISYKYLAVIDHGGHYYRAVIKLAQHPKYADHTPEIYTKSQINKWYAVNRDHDAQMELIPHLLFRRAARSFQAVPEILSFHVDRILGFYRKPPFVGRVLTNKELYGHIDVLTGWNPLTWLSLMHVKLQSFGRTENIYVSVTPWMDGITERPPSLAVKDALVHDSPVKRGPEAEKGLELLRTVSDTLVFDYLVDEHDRKAEKNWVVSKNGTYLHWDNGLAFDHGPAQRSKCIDILCGHNSWRDADGLVKKSDCRKVCRFRKRTYELLQMLSTPDYQLGDMLERTMRSDVLYPGFHLLVYERYWHDTQPVSFAAHELFDSTSARVDSLLHHIDSCRERYGDNEVFI